MIAKSRYAMVWGKNDLSRGINKVSSNTLLSMQGIMALSSTSFSLTWLYINMAVYILCDPISRHMQAG